MFETYTLYDDMLSQPHLLVAGATGSGKSVIINGMIYNGLEKNPEDFGMILIDPKRVELSAYRYLPHTLYYASEPEEMVHALEYAMQIVEGRFSVMQQVGLKKWSDGDIYVIIDELADLMTTDKKHVQPLIQRLCQIGRAARVHVVAATQCPISAVIPTPIKVNFDSRVGLRTRSAQDSRNILGIKGCEILPRYGEGFYMTPEGIEKYSIPMYSDSQLHEIIGYWMAQTVPKVPQKKSLFGRIKNLFR